MAILSRRAQQVRDQVIELRLAGLSREAISQRVGTSLVTVRAVLQDAGLPEPRRGPKNKPLTHNGETARTVMEMHNAGSTLSDISTATGYSRRAIRDYLNFYASNVPTRLFPLEPLIARSGGSRSVAKAVHTSGARIRAYRERGGLTEDQADEWALACGFLPNEVWDDFLPYEEMDA